MRVLTAILTPRSTSFSRNTNDFSNLCIILVSIQVPQPRNINTLLTCTRAGLEPGAGWDFRGNEPRSRSHRVRGHLISHTAVGQKPRFVDPTNGEIGQHLSIWPAPERLPRPPSRSGLDFLP